MQRLRACSHTLLFQYICAVAVTVTVNLIVRSSLESVKILSDPARLKHVANSLVIVSVVAAAAVAFFTVAGIVFIHSSIKHYQRQRGFPSPKTKLLHTLQLLALSSVSP